MGGHWRHLGIACALALAATLSACGGGDATPRATASTSPTTPASTGPAVLGDTTVQMLGPARLARYRPRLITIRAGSTVTWQDTGTTERHDVTFVLPGNDYTRYDPNRRSKNPQDIPKGATFSLTFDEPGEFRYLCIRHWYGAWVEDGMNGIVTVV